MHKLDYLGNQQYRCSKCELTTDKRDVSAFLDSPCSGDLAAADVSAVLASLTNSVESIVQTQGNLTKRLETLEQEAVIA